MLWEWRKIPIVDDAPDFQGSRRIALIDLEHMKGAADGFFGRIRGRGLIRCLSSEKHIDLALDIARRHGIRHFITSTEAKTARVEEIASDQQLIKIKILIVSSFSNMLYY